MRIIAGRLGGRNFAAPHGHHTHPMSDKIRGALFNSLGDIEGLSVLDAFAGSGALGFEAVSRGALSATLIENDKSAQRAIADNIAELGIAGQVKCVNAAAGSWLNTTDESFDIVLLDPPYDHLQPPLLSELAGRTKPGGVLVQSLPPAAEVAPGADFKLLLRKHYGDAELVFFRRTA